MRSELTPDNPLKRRSISFPLAAVLLPPAVFYVVLASMAVNLPILDDYDALLGFLNRLLSLPGLGQKVSYFFAAQHGEFKLLLLHAISLLQLKLTGHVNFIALSAIGNASIAALGLLLWKMFLPEWSETHQRLAYFIPVSLLLFQLHYWEALNFATPGLQHLIVLPFAFGSFRFAARSGRLSEITSLVCLVLSVASDGNGLVTIPIGAGLLMYLRQWKRLTGWIAVSALCVAIYAYHFNILSSSSQPHQSVVVTIAQFKPLFVLGLIGASASLSAFIPAAIAAGTLLCVYFAVLAKRGYARRNPLISGCIAFVLISVLGAGGLRADFGLVQLLAPRYTIYSVLLLIFAWQATVEEFLCNRRRANLQNNLFLSVVLATFLYAVLMDLAGTALLSARRNSLLQKMAAFEHPSLSNPAPSPATGFIDTQQLDPLRSFGPRARASLLESVRLGIYEPPRL